MRYILIDRIVEIEPGKRAKGWKNASLGEDYFQDHFPGFPAVPGALMIEAMAQLSGLLVMTSINYEKLSVLLGVSRARFREFVRPGDRLVVEAEIKSLQPSAAMTKCTVHVDDKLVAEAELMMGIQRPPGMSTEFVQMLATRYRMLTGDTSAGDVGTEA
ncbi:3-hydroxyacyl-ACP dehydratase FabZ [Myxococcota bacterium]|nr:3-hydroxyacyl-ACP dehydratase FabZ [Myxococcota bacterium]